MYLGSPWKVGELITSCSEKIEKYLGKINRLILSYEEFTIGGAYWCAVIHFVSISQWAIDEFMSEGRYS